MQILRNKTTNEEYPITGSIGVPREIDENTFEVWMHFSVDKGEGVVDTIEVHPENTEYEVFIAPDPVIEPEVVPEPEPVVEPEPIVVPEPTAEELAAQEEARIAMEAEQVFQTAKSEWLQKKQALTTMIDDMERGSKLGINPDETQVAIMTELAQWVNTNMDRRYYF